MDDTPSMPPAQNTAVPNLEPHSEQTPITPVATPIQPATTKPFPLNTILLALSLAALLLTGILIYQYQHLQKQLNQIVETQTEVKPTPLALPETTAEWKSYTNTQYQYEFKYPSNLTLYKEGEIEKVYNLTAIPVCNLDSTDCLFVDANQYSDIDFQSGGFSVNLLNKSDTRAKCDRSLIPGGKFTGTKTINQITYRTFIFTGAAAGNQSEDYIYITFQNNRCFEIIGRITTDSGNVNTTPAGLEEPLRENDKQNIVSLFDQILGSFKFSQPTNQNP